MRQRCPDGSVNDSMRIGFKMYIISSCSPSSDTKTIRESYAKRMFNSAAVKDSGFTYVLYQFTTTHHRLHLFLSLTFSNILMPFDNLIVPSSDISNICLTTLHLNFYNTRYAPSYINATNPQTSTPLICILSSGCIFIEYSYAIDAKYIQVSFKENLPIYITKLTTSAILP